MLLLLLACVPRLPAPSADLEPGAFSLRVEHQGRSRRARVFIPDVAEPEVMVLSLHGASQPPWHFRVHTGMERLAAEQGFVVVHPRGSGLQNVWSAYEECPVPACRGVDDVGYLSALIEAVRARVPVQRVYVAGFSNGSNMAMRLACETPLVDGVLAVSGGLNVSPCEGEPLPVLGFFGDADLWQPWRSGPSPKMGGWLEGVPETFEIWRARNRCSDAPPTETRHGEVLCQRWDCEAPTELCVVEGGGHTWPGSKPSRFFGYTTQDMDATRYGWSWLER